MRVQIYSWADWVTKLKPKLNSFGIDTDNYVRPSNERGYYKEREYYQAEIIFDQLQLLIVEFDVMIKEREGTTVIYLDYKGHGCRQQWWWN